MRTVGSYDYEERKKVVLDIAAHYVQEGPQVLGKRWDIEPHTIQAVASGLRKRGVKIPRRSLSSFYTPELIKELNKAAGNGHT